MKVFSKIFKNIALIAICFIASILMCYFIFDDILVLISHSTMGFIVIRIFLTMILYILVKSILNKSISGVQLKIFFVCYFILVLGFSLFKTGAFNNPDNINLNPFEFLKEIKLGKTALILILGNLFIYTPIGIFSKIIFSKKTDKFFVLSFLIYITAVETLQHILHLGIFDIDDIILNTIGFYFGLTLYKLYQRHIKIIAAKIKIN